MVAKIWKKEFDREYDFLSFTVILDDRGRITVPASIEKKFFIIFPALIISFQLSNFKKEEEHEKFHI